MGQKTWGLSKNGNDTEIGWASCSRVLPPKPAESPAAENQLGDTAEKYLRTRIKICLPTETAEPIVESAYFEMDRVYRLPMQTESSTWLGEDSVLSFVYVLCQTCGVQDFFNGMLNDPSKLIESQRNQIMAWNSMSHDAKEHAMVDCWFPQL